MGFSAQFENRAGIPVLAEGELAIRPLKWSAAAMGGPEAAVVELRGPRSALLAALDWLRYGVRIESPAGTAVWWGYVHAVEVHGYGQVFGKTLEGMCNRVAVIYRQEGTDGATTTEWIENAGSIAEYGRKEQLISLGQGTAEMASGRRDRQVTRFASPQPIQAFDESRGEADGYALLDCRGWAATLAWRYMQRTDGRVEWLGDGRKQSQQIGWMLLSSTLIGFGKGGLIDDAGTLGALREGNKLTIAGGVHNGWTFTAANAASDEVWELTSTNVWFDPADDIMSNVDEMGDIETETWLRVQGSTNNSRYHWVETASGTHLTTDTALSGTIVAESAGQTITLRQGQTLEVEETPQRVAPGAATINIVGHGYRMAQSFVVDTAMPAERMAIKACIHGAPSDGLTVQLCANASGAPGGVLASATAAAGVLPTDKPDWVWLIITPTMLAVGTYWLVVQRSGAMSAINYYEIEVCDADYGLTKQFNGGGWEAVTPTGSVPFMVWSAEDLGAQLRTVLDRVAQFTAGMDYALDFGIRSNPTMDQMATGWDAAQRLLEIGTSAGERVLLHVTAEKIVQVQKAAVSASDNNVLWAQGGALRVTDGAGSPWEPGVLPHGLWLEQGALQGESPALTEGLTPAFVEQAAYDADTGKLSITYAGAKTLADVLKVQQG